MTLAGKTVTRTFEALEHEMPLGLRFRKALLWHAGKAYEFRRLESIRRDRSTLQWILQGSNPRNGTTLRAVLLAAGSFGAR